MHREPLDTPKRKPQERNGFGKLSTVAGDDDYSTESYGMLISKVPVVSIRSEIIGGVGRGDLGGFNCLVVT